MDRGERGTASCCYDVTDSQFKESDGDQHLSTEKPKDGDKQPEYEGSPILLKGALDQIQQTQAQQQKEDRKYQDLQRKFDFSLVVFTGITALVGIVQGYLTWQAIDVASRQAASAERSNILTRQSMKYAYIQSRQAAKQSAIDNELSRQQGKAALDASIEASRRDQRAFMKLSGDTSTTAPIPLTFGESPSMPLTIINTGKTPAKAVDSTIVVSIFQKSEKFRINYPKALHPYTTSVGLAFPNDPEIIHLKPVKPTNGSEREFLIFTEELNEQMKKETAFYIVYAKITYLDIFGCAHWTHICEHSAITGSDVPGGINECAAYNDADNNACQPVTPTR